MRVEEVLNAKKIDIQKKFTELFQFQFTELLQILNLFTPKEISTIVIEYITGNPPDNLNVDNLIHIYDYSFVIMDSEMF